MEQLWLLSLSFYGSLLSPIFNSLQQCQAGGLRYLSMPVFLDVGGLPLFRELDSVVEL